MKLKLIFKKTVKFFRIVSSVVLLIILIPLLYLLISVDNLKSGIINYIESQGTEYGLLIDNVSVNPFNLSVNGVVLETKNIRLKIKTFGVVPDYPNLFKYFVLKDSSVELIDSLYANGVNVKYNYIKKQNSIVEHKNKNAKILEFISRVSVSNMKFDLIRDNKTIVELNNLNGKFLRDITSDYRYRFQIVGYYKKNKNPTYIDLMTNNFHNDIMVRAQFNDLNIDDSLSFKLFKNVDIYGGNIDGKIVAYIDSNGITTDGKLNISKVSWKFGKSVFENTYATLNFELDTIHVDNLVLKNGFNSTVVNGWYSFNHKYDFIASEFDSKIEDHFALAFFDSLKYKPSGNLTYILEAKNGEINSSFIIEKLNIDSIIAFDKISGKIEYKEGKLTIRDGLIADKLSKMYIKGEVSDKIKKFKFKGAFKNKKIKIKNKDYNLSLNIDKGIYKNGNVDINGSIHHVKIDNKDINKKNFRFGIRRNSNSLKISCGNFFVFNEKQNLMGKSFYGNWNNKVLNYFLPKTGGITGKGSIRGFYSIDRKIRAKILFLGTKNHLNMQSSLNLKGTYYTLDNNDIDLELSNVFNYRKNIFNINGSGNMINDNLSLQMFNLDSSLALKCDLINLSKRNKRRSNFKIKFNKFRRQIFLKHKNKLNFVGVGEIIGGGKFDNLKIESFLTFYNVKYNEIGPLTMNLRLKYFNDSLFNIDPISIGYKKYELMRVSNLLYNKGLQFEIYRDSVDLDVINKVYKNIGLSGKLKYRVKFKSDEKLKNLKSNFKLYIFNAMIKNYTIKKFSAEGGIKNNFIFLNNSSILMPDLKMKIDGIYPLIKQKQDSLDLNINFSGAFFSEATKKIKFIKGISGEKSKGNINMGFDNEKLILNGNISTFAKYVYLKDVIPVIKDSKIDINLKRNKMIYNSKSWVDDSWVKLFNYFDANDSNDFKIGDFNLGKLGVKHDKKGVDFHFTSFQNKADRGKAYFIGKDKYKYFTLTGPFDNISLIGGVRLFNTQFSVPIEKKGPKKSLSKFVREHFNLNLDLITGNHVNYYFQSNNYFKGQKIVDIMADEGLKLTVKGKITDRNLKLFGYLSSTNSGKLFLGRYFKTEKVEVEFIPLIENNGTVNNIPILSGGAYLLDKDENNVTKKVEVVLKVKENNEDFYKTRGRPGKIKFDATAPGYINEKEYNAMQKEFLSKVFGMSSLDEKSGESSIDLSKQAVSLGENYLMNRYVNNFIGEYLRIPYLDVVKFNSNILSNFYGFQFDGLEKSSNLNLIRGSSFELGSFVFDKMFLNYQGTVDINLQNNLYLKHTFGIEYSLNPMVQFKFDLNYDPVLNLTSPYKSYGVQFNIPLNILNKRK